MRVRLFKKTKDNLSYFQFLSNDDQPVLNSQGYADKDDRNNAVRTVIASAADGGRYERQASAEGKNYFLLKAGNGQEIARSVEYDSGAAMEAAISACAADIRNIVFGEEGEAPAAAAPRAADPNPYDGQDGDDNYKRLAFYQSRIKGVANGFDPFATEEGKFYFTLNLGGKIILLSETYNSQDGRNNGSESVTKNLPIADRYQHMTHPNGKHYFNLLAGNNQQIATSIWFDSEAEMNEAIRSLRGGLFGGTEAVVLREAGEGVSGEVEGMTGYRAAVEIAAAPQRREVEKPKEKKKHKSKKEKSADEKVFLKSGEYRFNGVTYQTMRSGNGKHYFSFRTAEGKSLLNNANVAGFETEDEMDAAVQKVINLGPYEGNYEGKTTVNGKYYFYLNDTVGKAVGKSFFYDTAEDMQSAIGLLIGSARIATAEVPQTITNIAMQDDYLLCESYRGEPGFHRFFNADDESWYFAFNDANGNTYLRSEGYSSEKSRDNGIESVLKNAAIEERWVTDSDAGGYYYYALRAGNNQEIARSCPYDSEAEMLAALAWVRGEDSIIAAGAEERGGIRWSAGMIRRQQEEEEETAARAAEETRLRAEAEAKAAEEAAARAAEEARLRAEAEAKSAEEARLQAEAEAKAAEEARVTREVEAAAVAAAASQKVEDDYLICRMYKARIADSKSEKYPGFIAFQHENGKHYFGWIDDGDDLLMRGEGYPTTAARDNGIESVMKNRDIEERYGTEERHGAWFAVLKAGNRQEIARSCPSDSEAVCLALFPAEREKTRAAKMVAAAPVAVRASDKLADDYLPCEEYRQRIADSKSERYPGFITFQHENGNHYFAWLDEDGDLRMRGEGYPTTGARNNGIESVIKNRDIEERYSSEEIDGRWYIVLKAGNRQEIARSCSKESSAAALAWFPGARKAALATAAAFAAAAVPVVTERSAVKPPIVTEKKVVAPIVTEKKAAVPPPPPRVVQTAPPPPPVVESSGGGFKWWWLLPLLLIPLFFMWRGCEGCNKTAVVAPPVEQVVVLPVDTVKKAEPVPVPPPVPQCACKGSDNAIFNIPEGATPKVLTRLGTNPEFGDSHGLDGAGFYAKIANNAKRFPRDKKFLDGVFAAMGYANGFADAKAEMFSEVTVPAGTVGNMGYSVAHKTLYARVPDTERDRLAFLIKSANGCDLHFMKTCGNHFFYCPN